MNYIFRFSFCFILFSISSLSLKAQSTYAEGFDSTAIPLGYELSQHANANSQLIKEDDVLKVVVNHPTHNEWTTLRYHSINATGLWIPDLQNSKIAFRIQSNDTVDLRISAHSNMTYVGGSGSAWTAGYLEDLLFDSVFVECFTHIPDSNFVTYVADFSLVPEHLFDSTRVWGLNLDIAHQDMVSNATIYVDWVKAGYDDEFTPNRAPTITEIPDRSHQMAGAQTFGLAFNVTDGGDTDNQELSFTITSDNDSLVDENFILTYYGLFQDGSHGYLLKYNVLEAVYGTANISIKVKDDGGTIEGGIDSVITSVAINVSPIPNLPPTIDPIGDQIVTVRCLPSGGKVTLTGVSDGDINKFQNLSFSLSSSDQSVLQDDDIYIQPENITGVYYVQFDEIQSIGTTTITAIIKDDGGTENGGTDSLVVSFDLTLVPNVNESPIINHIRGVDVYVYSINGEHRVKPLSIKDGDEDKQQNLTIEVNSSNETLLPVGNISVIQDQGDIYFVNMDILPGASGETTVTILARDDGGTCLGGNDFEAITFRVIVFAECDFAWVNDIVNECLHLQVLSGPSPTDTLLTLHKDGGLGINTFNVDNEDFKLSVGGHVRTSQLYVGAVDRWSDFVFNDYGKEGFENESLQEVKQYIDTYGHLPEQTSAKEVEQNGYLLGDMDAKLLERIERLYLHAIAQDKKIKALKEQLNQ